VAAAVEGCVPQRADQWDFAAADALEHANERAALGHVAACAIQRTRGKHDRCAHAESQQEQQPEHHQQHAGQHNQHVSEAGSHAPDTRHAWAR
jgi:hypothetical protein